MESYEMDKFLEYIRPEDNELLSSMRKYAIENYVPIIKNEMKQFLETIVFMHKPYKILEIGTAIGYSSITMTNVMEKYADLEQCLIISIERNDEMYEQAISNIIKAGHEKVIQVKHDEAEAVLQQLVDTGEQFDMVFMDAAKGQYLTFLPNCMTLLKVQGLLVSDNVLQGGDVAKSRFSVPRRQRTIHQRMREYLWELNHRDDLQTSILDIADGATISVKLK